MLFSSAWDFFGCLRRDLRSLACLEEAESQGGGYWPGGWGRRALAALSAIENHLLPGDWDVRVCVCLMLQA